MVSPVAFAARIECEGSITDGADVGAIMLLATARANESANIIMASEREQEKSHT